jgi:hypothetical protein
LTILLIDNYQESIKTILHYRVASALGTPIIVAPPIESHEVLNRRWLLDSHTGIAQDDSRYCLEWLLDLHRGGRLAEAAWNGFRKGMKYATFSIQDMVNGAAASIEKGAERRIG